MDRTNVGGEGRGQEPGDVSGGEPVGRTEFFTEKSYCQRAEKDSALKKLTGVLLNYGLPTLAKPPTTFQEPLHYIVCIAEIYSLRTTCTQTLKILHKVQEKVSKPFAISWFSA